MGMTSTIADFFSRIRNAVAVKKDFVEVPASRTKIQIVSVLKEEGFISDYEIIPDQKGGKIKVYLKYFYPEPKQKISVIRGLQILSKPGRRVYMKVEQIPQVYGGTGIVILSTSRGIMSSTRAKAEKIGGEAIAKVW